MSSRLDEIKARLAVYDDNRVTLEHLSRLSNSGKIPTAEPGTLSKVIAFQAELADDLRALLAVVDAAVAYVDAAQNELSAERRSAARKLEAALAELTEGGA